MLLTIDAGNTNIVFALQDRKKIVFSFRLETKRDVSFSELEKDVNAKMDLLTIDKKAINGAIIASVVPEINDHLKTLAEKLSNSVPFMVELGKIDLGLDILVDNPAEVGADRLVNAVAGFELYGGPLILLDFGTATTFDVVSKEGAYLGGVICPGINLSFEALANATSKLPNIKIKKPTTDIVTGHNTIEAMQSGAYWGYMGLIEGLIDRLKAEHGKEAQVVGTGGLVDLFADKTDKIDHVRRGLTVQGLRILYERQKNKL